MRTHLRIFFTLISILVGIAIIVIVVVVPSLRSITTLATHIEQKRNQAGQSFARAAQFRATADLLTEIHRTLPVYERMIIEGGKEIDFFTLLENKNKQHNLDQLVRLSPSVEILPSLEELPIEFQIQGAFENIISYIQELERADELIAIRSVTILRSPKGQDKKPLTATIKGSL